mgnify:FL=1
MSDSFIMVLIGAVIILVLFMGIFGVIDYQGELPQFIPKAQEKGAKGFSSSSISLDDSIVFKSASKILGNISGVVTSSLFENSFIEAEINSGNYTHGVIELEVHNANPKGSLILYSDEEIYRKVPGHGIQYYEFNPSKLDGRIKAAVPGPGLFFWETSEYNFTAIIRGDSRLEGYYTFYANSGKEYTLFGSIEDSYGGIDIYLNNRVVYSGGENETIDIDLEGLSNKNVLRFAPWSDSKYEFSHIYLQMR